VKENQEKEKGKSNGQEKGKTRKMMMDERTAKNLVVLLARLPAWAISPWSEDLR
jgi:hypothetical protein